jgi:hypothetical protein
MNPQLKTSRRALAALLTVLGLALGTGAALVSGAAPAGAHEGAGTLTVEQVHPAGLSIHYIVLLTWENDGHPAEDATVTATPVGPDGAALTPVTLAPSGAGDGRYAGAVEFPSAGSWTVRFTSIEPTGSAERPEQVTEPSTTTAGEGGSGTDATTATGEPGVALADDDTGGSAAADDEGDSGGIPVLLIVGAAVVAIGGVVTALLAIRRYRPDLAEGAPAGSGDAATPGPEAGAAATPGTDAGPESAATDAGVDGAASDGPTASGPEAGAAGAAAGEATAGTSPDKDS